MKKDRIIQLVLMLLLVFLALPRLYSDDTPGSVEPVDEATEIQTVENEPNNPDSNSISAEKVEAGDRELIDTILNKGSDMVENVVSEADIWIKMPEDVSDGNPDHIYFYIHQQKRWIWTMKDDPQGLEHGIHYAPFDYDAGTGAFIRFDVEEGKWFSFAPFHNGEEIEIYPDGIQLPESVSDGNPDHIYYFDPAIDRWFFTVKGTGKVNRAPFDDDAGTGAYIRYDKKEGKWYSFAPLYEGDEVEIFPEPEPVSEPEPPVQAIQETFEDQGHDHERTPVPEKEVVTNEDIDRGGESKVSLSFLLDGWSFREFYEWVEKRGFKILFIGTELEEVNLEIVELDADGNPLLERKKWDGSYEPRLYSVENIPMNESVAQWAVYDDLLRDKHGLDPSFKMYLYFPLSVREDIGIIIKERIGSSGEFEGKVIFTITRDGEGDYEYEIIEIEESVTVAETATTDGNGEPERFGKEDVDVEEIQEPPPLAVDDSVEMRQDGDASSSISSQTQIPKTPVKEEQSTGSMEETEQITTISPVDPEKVIKKAVPGKGNIFSGNAGSEEESDVDAGKKIDASLYSFTLDGWDFAEFFKLVKYSGMKIRFSSIRDKQQYVGTIISEESNVNHVLENDVAVDKNNYSENEYPLFSIMLGLDDPDFSKGIIDRIDVFFPYYVLTYLEEAAKNYYIECEVNPETTFASVCAVEFTISKKDGYEFKIQEMRIRK